MYLKALLLSPLRFLQQSRPFNFGTHFGLGFTCNAPLCTVHTALGVEHVHVAKIKAGWICLRPASRGNNRDRARRCEKMQIGTRQTRATELVHARPTNVPVMIEKSIVFV